MSEVKIIRLITGEDVIGKLIKIEDKLHHISKAFVIIPTQSAPGQPVQLMLTPYMPYAREDTIIISSGKIITIVDPKDEILKAYQQNTSSILTAKKPGLITETKIPRL